MLKIWINHPLVVLHFFVLFAFVIVRAIFVPIVSDEAFTYFLYVEPQTILPPNVQVDANNHYLNSLLSIGSIKLFGLSAFSFRLPNVLAFVLFYFSSFKIASFFDEKWKFWVSLIALNSIYPLIEFFSLARGYGLSFALLLFGIYQTMAYFDDKKNLRAWLILITIIVTLTAQLSLLFAGAALLFLVSYNFIKYNWKKSKISALIYSIISLLVLLFFTLHIKELQDGGFLYFGERDDFPLENIISLNDLLFRSTSKGMYYLTLSGFLLVFILSTVLIFKKKVFVFSDKKMVFPLVLWSSIIGTLMAVFLLDGTGPLARTGLYLYLLLIGSLLFFGSMNRWLNYGFSTLLVAASLCLFSQMNFEQVNYWANQKVHPKIYKIIAETTNERMSIGSSIYIDRNIEMEMNHFLRISKSVEIIENNISDYSLLLLTPGDVLRFKDELKYYQALYSDKTGVSLYKTKSWLPMPILLESIDIEVENSNQEFIGITSYLIQSTETSKRAFVLSGEMQCTKSMKTASFNLVIQFFDTDGTAISGRYHPVNRMSQGWNKSKAFSFRLTVSEIPDSAEEMRIYLYNPLKLSFDKINIKGKLEELF